MHVYNGLHGCQVTFTWPRLQSRYCTGWMGHLKLATPSQKLSEKYVQIHVWHMASN